MSWLARILGRKPAADTAMTIIEGLAKAATDLHAWRLAVAQAAERGDLDDVFSRIEAEKRKTDEWIQGG